MRRFDIWTRLARECFMSRDGVKRICYDEMYGRTSDPWVRALVVNRLYELQREMYQEIMENDQ